MPVYERKTMCSECPFKANSLPGYLGPLTIEDLERVVHGSNMVTTNDGHRMYFGEMGDMLCHKDIDRMKEAGIPDLEWLKKGQNCVGMARYSNAVCKSTDRKKLAKFKIAVGDVPDAPVIAPFKLREHHGG